MRGAAIERTGQGRILTQPGDGQQARLGCDAIADYLSNVIDTK